MDNLTLEHLVPYLPHGLKCHNMGNIDEEGHAFVSEIVGLDQDYVWVSHEHEDDYYAYSDTFPLLIPLSALTVEFFEENIDDAIVDFLINCEPENNHFSVEVCDKVIGWTAISYEEYQLFFKNHFDVFGLIEKGLAIDYNTVKGGPNEI